ncbi:SDR family oxidoreductase [Aquibium sp. LZ166]|uniref:SDR family oxidoreductase n=1 Tax=Aquibium pacificus TaxID=3153579 RepID=A0ABV3SRV8_9HYPH
MAPDPSRIAVVTGAAGGIGRATTLRLLACGWSVAGVDRVRIADIPPEFRDGFLSIECDLTDPAVPAEIIARTVRHFGSVGLLVNNAGISGAKPVAETDDANLARIMDINFTVPFRMSREALKVMQAGASIVHVSSVVNFRATPSTSAYTASKAALAGLTRQMAAEYGPRGIRCNAVAPGLVETELTAEKLRTDPKFQRIWIEGTPWPRLGRPEDIAAAIVFLASTDAEFINGHTLVIDGGWSIGASAA